MIYDIKITNDIINYRRPLSCDREENILGQESTKENLSGQNNIGRKLLT